MAPLIILVEFLVKPDFAERFAKVIAVNAKASVERERGCQRFDVLLVPEEPRRFWLYEIYDDDRAFDRHIQSRHFKVFAKAIDGQIEERRVWRLGFQDGSPNIRKAARRTGGKAKDGKNGKTRAKAK